MLSEKCITFYIRIFTILPPSNTKAVNKIEHFKGTLKVYLNIHSFCSNDKFLKSLTMMLSYLNVFIYKEL